MMNYCNSVLVVDSLVKVSLGLRDNTMLTFLFLNPNELCIFIRILISLKHVKAYISGFAVWVYGLRIVLVGHFILSNF